MVTEIAYNYKSNDYEADIQFLSREEWRHELEILLPEVRHNDMNAQEKVALAKFKAVYPR